MQASTEAGETPQALYLDLMKRVLIREGFASQSRPVGMPRGISRFAYIPARKILAARRLELVRRINPISWEEGRVFPHEAETMIGRARLENLQHCVTDVLERSIPGDLIETGVWRGGASIFMRAILKAYGDTERAVWAADSFEGLPKPDAQEYPADAGDPHWKSPQLAVSIEQVKANFSKYGLLDNQVRFLKGWFRDTLPHAPVDRLSVLRLDGDMYESTMIALTALYPKLSKGGYVIIDDYGAVKGCRAAVEEFRTTQGITDQIEQIDWTGVFWQRQP